MASVAVNPPKTPVTKGSNGIATATLPNICKMPPPPPPFCPTPLPNIGMSGKNPQKYTTTVKVEKQFVAIQGASFDSVGDIASKATGGGVVSNNAEGPTTFVTLGATNTRFESKDVQFLGDLMLNNCGPTGTPANSATMAGVIQVPVMPMAPPADFLREIACRCDAHPDNNGDANGPFSCRKAGVEKHACCDKALDDHAKSGNPPKVGGESGYTSATSTPPFAPITGSRMANFAAGTLPKGSMWPDAMSLDPKQIFDFKFKCKTAKYPGPPTWQSSTRLRSQLANYTALGAAKGVDNRTHPPKIIHNLGCGS